MTDTTQPWPRHRRGPAHPIEVGVVFGDGQDFDEVAAAGLEAAEVHLVQVGVVAAARPLDGGLQHAGQTEPEAVDHGCEARQGEGDPGGLLPDWLVKLTSRKLPIETLVGLRNQVAKTRGKYEAFLKRYDPSHGGKIPDVLLK